MGQLFIADLKMMFRNRQALFWTLAFPLIFTLIFGAFFGRSNESAGTVALVQESNSSAAKAVVTALEKSKAFKIQTTSSVSAARDLVKSGKSVAIVDIPAQFGTGTSSSAETHLSLYYDQSDLQAEAAVAGYINSVLTTMSYAAQGARPIYQLDTARASGQSYSYFDFILIGIVGMALMNSSILGVSVAMSKYRDDKIFKRITTTPLPAAQFIGAETLSRLVLNFVQISLILAVGIYLFHAHIYGNIGLVYLFSLVGALLFLAFGFAVASLSKTTEAAEGMATAITVPMMFLGGVFFPIDQLPKWLYSIVQFLPISPLLRTMRNVSLESQPILQSGRDLIIIAGWIMLMLALAAWKFRLVED